MQVSSVMKRNPEMVSPDLTVREAAEKMREINAGILPVGEEHETAIGMLTDRDITVRATAEGKDPTHTLVKDIMTEEVITCSESDSARNAFQKMQQHGVGRLLVTDMSGHISGIVTMRELLAEASGELWECVANDTESRKN